MQRTLSLRLAGSVLALLCAVIALSIPCLASDRLSLFLTVNGVELRLGERTFRNVGANMPDLFELFLHGRDQEAERALDEAQMAGIRFVRCFGSTWGPKDFHLFEDDQARWLDAYDRMLSAADRRGIAVVPSLLFNAHMIPDYLRSSGKNQGLVDLFTPGGSANHLAFQYVTTIVNRYKDDPRILFWEIGNEYNLEADLSSQWKRRPANETPTSNQVRDFLAAMATEIKRLDSHHPVTSGNADMRPYAWHIRQSMLAQRGRSDSLAWPMDYHKDSFDEYVQMLRFFNPPPLDIISVHEYPLGKDAPDWLIADDSHAGMLPWSRRASERIGLPLFVGEFGATVYAAGKEQRVPWIEDCMAQLRRGVAPIAAVWTWEYNSNDRLQDRYALSPSKTPNLANLLTQINHDLDSMTGSR